MNNHGKFSKRVITAMIVLWFCVALYGAVFNVVMLFRTPEIVNLDSFYLYVGAPISGGIVTYLIKSAMENKEKIKNNPDEDEIEELNDFENI